MIFSSLPRKTYALFTFIFLLSLAAHSQEKDKFFNSPLWIKNDEKPKEKANGPEVVNAEKELKTHFNFNPVIDFSKKDIVNKYKNIVKKEYTLFVVFQCSSKEENPILLLEKGGSKTLISTKKIQSDSDLTLSKGNPEKGMLLSYMCNKNSILSKKKGSISIDDMFFLDRGGKNRMMELIYFPDFLSKSEQNSIESYLSIKYGISLIGDKDYYNSAGDKIWNFKNCSDFNSRVTGIGRDDFFDLNQKQSGNSEKDGLYLGFDKLAQNNSENKSIIEDKSFLLWGDNNKSTLISKNDGGYQKMERIWKIQTRGKISATQMVISKEEMMLGNPKKENDAKEDYIWLAIDTTHNGKFDYLAAKYIKSKDTETQLVFDQIEWKKDTTSTFTFVKAPDFFIIDDAIAADCGKGEKGKLKIKIVGGTAPYYVHLSSANYEKKLSLNEDSIEMNDLGDGDYALEVTDSKSQVEKRAFSIDGFTDTAVTMAKEWILDENRQAGIKPLIENAAEITAFEWYDGKVLLSSDKEIVLTKPGNYQLLLTNRNGCKKTLDFSVLENKKATADEITVFPNPVKASNNFTVRFNLQNEQNVSIALYDINSKMIKSTDLGLIRQFEYKDNLRVSGTYLIVITKNGVVKTTKLIVE